MFAAAGRIAPEQRCRVAGTEMFKQQYRAEPVGSGKIVVMSFLHAITPCTVVVIGNKIPPSPADGRIFRQRSSRPPSAAQIAGRACRA